MKLYHATPKKELESIARAGLRPGTYLTSNLRLAEYYAECIEDEGMEAALLAVSLERLDESLCSPDLPGIEEPICTVVGMKEEEIQHRWYEGGQSWRDCLELIGSIKYQGAIAPAKILLLDSCDPEHDHSRLTDMLEDAPSP